MSFIGDKLFEGKKTLCGLTQSNLPRLFFKIDGKKCLVSLLKLSFEHVSRCSPGFYIPIVLSLDKKVFLDRKHDSAKESLGQEYLSHFKRRQNNILMRLP